MFGSTIEVVWRGRPVIAFVPVSLADLEPPSTAAIRGAALAEGALTAVDDRLHSGLEVPARLLLRAEGVASSRIEEIHAPAAEIAVADADSADRGGYLSGLTLYREQGPEPWLRWFAGAVERTARSTETILTAILELSASWPDRLSNVRADAAAHKLLPHLTTHPALDVATAAALADVTEQAARAALNELTARGILRDGTPPDHPDLAAPAAGG